MARNTPTCWWWAIPEGQGLVLTVFVAHKEESTLADSLILDGLTTEIDDLSCEAEEDISENDRDLRCQIMIYKPNGEKISVYTDNRFLEKAEDNLKKKFSILTRASNNGWKFAIASNLTSWKIYGSDKRKTKPHIMSTEVFEIKGNPIPKKTSLNPLLRALLTIIKFDIKQWDFEPESDPMESHVVSSWILLTFYILMFYSWTEKIRRRFNDGSWTTQKQFYGGKPSSRPEPLATSIGEWARYISNCD